VPLDEKTMLARCAGIWKNTGNGRWGPDYQRALEIEAMLVEVGQNSIEAVFTNAKMMRVYEQFR